MCGDVVVVLWRVFEAVCDERFGDAIEPDIGQVGLYGRCPNQLPKSPHGPVLASPLFSGQDCQP